MSSTPDSEEIAQSDTQVQECLKMLHAVLAKPNMNETARKELFISYLRSIFPQQHSKIDALAQGAEAHVKTAPTNLSTSTRGFIDTHNGNLIIEYKANLADLAALRTAHIELKRYFAALWTSEAPDSSFCGIVTDIMHWKIYRPTPSTLPDNGSYTADMVELELLEEFAVIHIDKATAHHLFLLLKRVLIDENLLVLSSENIRRDFGLQSMQFELIAREIEAIVKDASSNSEVKLMLNLWKEHQIYNAYKMRSVDINLYVKHIYLVLIARLIVAAFFENEIRNTNDETIRYILTGRFYRQHFLQNFIERDFFGWSTISPWLEEFIPISRLLLHNLRTYDFKKASAENVLQLIYNEMLPQDQQDVFGQRSTPEPLINEITKTLINGKTKFRYLDPACGTGSFIRVILVEARKILETQGVPLQEQLQILTDCVTGIDIDPIAVILSKTTWALTLADLIKQAEHPVTIPIYHADSLFVVTDQRLIDEGETASGAPARITFDNAVVEVPLELFNNTRGFDRLVEWCHTKAEALARDAQLNNNTLPIINEETIERNLALILESESEKLMEKRAEVAKAASQLTAHLARRILDKRNGVWAFVLRNSYRPSFFKGRFDLIATNPPWLAMSSIPNVPYKKQLLEHTDHFNIRPQGSSFLHTEIATTFALHAVNHFLADEGQAAFVMPRSIFDGDQHHKFRTFQFKSKTKVDISQIWDLDSVDGLFRIPSCVIWAHKNPDSDNRQEEHIPARFYAGQVSNFKVDHKGSIRLVRRGDKSAWVEDSSDSSPVDSYNYYRKSFRQGADLMPRTALFVEITSPESRHSIAVQTSELEVQNPNGKVLKGMRFRNVVNRRYLFSTVTSNYLLPFVILEDQLPLVLLPIEIDEQENTIMILKDHDLIDRGDTGIVEWVDAVDEALSNESNPKSIRERIDERGKLTQQRYQDIPYLVHYGASGSHICAAVQHMHENTRFVADQTTYVYPTSNKDEAYYLAGMLNSTAISQLIDKFQSRGDFGKRHIHMLPLDVIPKFKPDDPVHKQVSQTAEEITGIAYNKLDDYMKDITKRVSNRRTNMRVAITDQLKKLDQIVSEIFNQ